MQTMEKKREKKPQNRMRQENRSMGESLRVEAAAAVERERARERITQREVNHERTAKNNNHRIKNTIGKIKWCTNKQVNQMTASLERI